MNERMTKRDTDGQAMMDCEKCKADWTGKHGKPMADCTALYCRNRLLDRLVAYEDTGWTPEMLHKLGENAGLMWDFAQAAEKMTVGRLKELAEADKDGRVVVQPCKVGDVVYGFHNNRQTILPMVVKWIETNADGWTVAAQYTPMAPKFYQFSDFGKTVFLTREEAEKALQKMEGRS